MFLYRYCNVTVQHGFLSDVFLMFSCYLCSMFDLCCGVWMWCLLSSITWSKHAAFKDLFRSNPWNADCYSWSSHSGYIIVHKIQCASSPVFLFMSNCYLYNILTLRICIPGTCRWCWLVLVRLLCKFIFFRFKKCACYSLVRRHSCTESLNYCIRAY